MTQPGEAKAHLVIDGSGNELKSWLAIDASHLIPNFLAGVAMGAIRVVTGNDVVMKRVDIEGLPNYHCFSIEPPISSATAQEVIDSLGDGSKNMTVSTLNELTGEKPAQANLDELGAGTNGSSFFENEKGW